MADPAVAELWPASAHLTDAAAGEEALAILSRLLAADSATGRIELLPALFRLKGRPYTLDARAPMEALFAPHLPRKLTVQSGRQVSKTTTSAAVWAVLGMSNPHRTLLHVSPLGSQAQRFSNDFFRPFVDESPLKGLLVDKTCEQQVFRRRLTNKTLFHFSYAGLDVERIRGIPADAVHKDEIQNMDPDHQAVIDYTMAASDWKFSLQTGTPLTDDCIIQAEWTDSSMAEWLVPCRGCGHRNIPSLEYDLDAMIGPERDDIGPDAPGIVCAKCQKPVFPSRDGFWLHRFPDRFARHAGYHLPQVILPIHYADPTAWGEIVRAWRGGGYAPYRVINEVFGESASTGAQLVSESDLLGAATLGWANDPNDPDARVFDRSPYVATALAADWGGGGTGRVRGGDEDRPAVVSWTALALLGLRPGGGVDVLWGKRLLTPYDHYAEVDEVLAWLRRFRPNFFVHDYGGIGTHRQTMLVDRGLNPDGIIPVRYQAQKKLVATVPAEAMNPFSYKQLEKSRSLLDLVNALRRGMLRTFAFDGDLGPASLLREFTALITHKVESHQADLYKIVRKATRTDDFVQAINIGAAMLWHTFDAYPVRSDRIDHPADRILTPVQESLVHGLGDWYGPPVDPAADAMFGG